jgi:hypothetical protein
MQFFVAGKDVGNLRKARVKAGICAWGRECSDLPMRSGERCDSSLGKHFRACCCDANDMELMRARRHTRAVSRTPSQSGRL